MLAKAPPLGWSQVQTLGGVYWEVSVMFRLALLGKSGEKLNGLVCGLA